MPAPPRLKETPNHFNGSAGRIGRKNPLGARELTFADGAMVSIA
ncbi:hypothetical protein [Methylocapsa sp. S129]|nr:hypothetical protein [Methylocapsa sp. S129]